MFLRSPFRPPAADGLGEMPLFEGLSQQELAAVARLSTPITLPAGRVLARQGEAGSEFFLLLDGEVDVVRRGEVIATRGAGCHLGEIALLAARPRTATLLTTTPVRTRVASQREFSGMLAAVPRLAERLQATMDERLAA